MTELEPLYRIPDELGGRWRKSKTTTYRLVKKYQMKTFKIGRDQFTPASEVARVEAEHMRDPSKAA